MNRRRIVSGLLGALVALALVGVTQAEAQSAAQFVGKWTITFAPPAGAPGGGAAGGPPPGAGAGGGGGGGGFRGGPTVLEVTQTGGTLAATMTGGFGGRGFGGGGGAAPAGAPAAGGAPAAPAPMAITDVKVVNGSLVLSYTQTMGQGGQAVPITLKLTPDGAGMKVEQDRGNGMIRTGTAVKG